MNPYQRLKKAFTDPAEAKEMLSENDHMDTEYKSPRILRMKDLPAKVGFAPSTIYELVAKGEFPRPFKILPSGRAAGWLESTIDEWLRQCSMNNDGG